MIGAARLCANHALMAAPTFQGRMSDRLGSSMRRLVLSLWCDISHRLGVRLSVTWACIPPHVSLPRAEPPEIRSVPDLRP
jgi:hypothetical protein